VTAYSDIEQSVLDIDWFAVDRDGNIAHLTTAARRALPTAVASSKEDLEALLEFFKALPETGGGSKENPAYRTQIAALASRFGEICLDDSLSMADRGLYSFDASDKRDRHGSYVLVATPGKPIHVDQLPGHVQRLVLRARIQAVRFADTNEFAPPAE